MLKLGPELFELLNAKQWVGDRQPVIYGKGGLSILQIQLIEAQLGFGMPEDFSYLLQNIRDPGGVLFPWANFRKQKYVDAIAGIFQGIEFDIEHNNLWLRRWGERPTALSTALEIARGDFSNWPKLLPVYGHRFLAVQPCRSNNPVFSIVQTDIIYYGANLAHYLLNEFVRDSSQRIVDRPIHTIEIWSDFAENREEFFTKGLGAEQEARTADLLRRAARRISDGSQTSAVRIELLPNGTILIAGETVAGHDALEAKLHQMMSGSLPLDLYLQPHAEGAEAERLAALLRELGFTPMVMARRHESGFQVFSGWRFG
jgi:hypothetical protein